MMTYKDTTLWKEAFNDKYGHIVWGLKRSDKIEIG